MRILQLTPGTGSFHCGSCIRDRALQEALRARGHDVQALQLYLPPCEELDSREEPAPIRMGALNLYLQQKLPLALKLPRVVANLLDSPRLLRWVSKHSGATSPGFLGEMALSMLRGEEGRLRREFQKLATALDGLPKVDVVLLSNVMLSGVVKVVKQHCGAPVLSTLQGEIPFLDSLPEPHHGAVWELLSERARELDGLIAVSHEYARRIGQRLRIEPGRIDVAWNGLDLADCAGAHGGPVPEHPTIGFLSRMCAEKGLPLLIEAFCLLSARASVPGLRLRVAGVERGEDSAPLQALRRRLQAAGAADAVEFLPNLAAHAKPDFLRSLTVLSVPATPDESFGLYLLEALAAGVPVVQPRHAAFPELLAATGGGRLCEADDPVALADALEELLLDPVGARELGAAGRTAVLRDFTSDRMAREVERVLARCSTTTAEDLR